MHKQISPLIHAVFVGLSPVTGLDMTGLFTGANLTSPRRVMILGHADDESGGMLI